MVEKEFIVTGQLKETNGTDKQMLILHRSFFTSSKEEAIKNFHTYFEPELKVIKIFSVVDDKGILV
jgi:hypothetical protein